MEALGFEVYNPNCAECAEGYTKGGMEFFRDIIQACDGIAVRGFLDASLPADVGKEVLMAREMKKLIIELPTAIDRRILSVEATRAALQECGFR